MPEIKFTRSESLALASALDARNAKLKNVQEAVDRAQLEAQQAGVEYDSVLLEILQGHGVEKLPARELEPAFYPNGSKRPDGIRWKEEPAAKAPPQGKAALDAATKELGVDAKGAPAIDAPPPARPLAAQVAATP